MTDEQKTLLVRETMQKLIDVVLEAGGKIDAEKASERIAFCCASLCSAHVYLSMEAKLDRDIYDWSNYRAWQVHEQARATNEKDS